jgi:hypothetical protein
MRADRSRIVAQLNTLARRLTGKSFNDLCQEQIQATYNFSSPANFDLDELINQCQCELRKRQGLVGLGVPCISSRFLPYFQARLKVALGRNNIFTPEPITFSAIHTPIEKSIELVKRHLFNLRQSDVLVRVLINEQAAAERFWQGLTNNYERFCQQLANEFNTQSNNRFIVIMAMESELSFPQGLINIAPPCFNEGHIYAHNTGGVLSSCWMRLIKPILIFPMIYCGN